MRRHAKAPSAAWESSRVKKEGSRASSATVFLALAFVLLCLLPVGASAKLIHNPFGTFGSAAQPIFQNAEGLAVDQSNGDLLVIDQVAGTISRFKPDGTPDDFSALGTNVINGSSTPQGHLSFGGPSEVQVAVDNSGGVTDGNIYVTQAGARAIYAFASSGAYLGRLTHYKEGADASGPSAELGEPCGVAVDLAGNVYVGDYSANSVHKYAPSANPPVDGDNSANLTFEGGCTLAAGAGGGATAGFIFPIHYGGALAKLDATSGKENVVDPASNTTVSVNPANGHVYTAVGSEVREYDASGASEAKLLSSFSATGSVRGVAIDEASGNVYVAPSGSPAPSGSHQIEVWGPAVVLADVTTEDAIALTPSSATLHGTISAANGPNASCEFQYTTEASFEAEGFQGASSAPCTPGGPFTGNATTAVSANIGGLSSSSSYRFRILGSNSNGINDGQALKLQTVGPVISGVTVSAVTDTTATIIGNVDPHGNPTAFTVEYVDDADFQASGFANATSSPAPPEDLGSGNAPIEVSAELKGLTPGTTYHFRLAALSEFNGNPVNGLSPEATFTTFTTPTGLPDGRAYEMVSPAVKIGEVFSPEPYEELGGSRSCSEFCQSGIDDVRMPVQATPDGDRLLFEGQPFSEGLAPSGNQYLSRRSPSGWATQSITPLRVRSGSAEGEGFKAYSPDLTKGVLYQSTPALSPEVPAGENEFHQNYRDLYLWEEGNPNLRPLVTVKPPNRAPGLGVENTFLLSFGGGNSGSAAEPAFTHLAFEANDALTPAVPGIAPAAPEVEAGRCEDVLGADCNLYEWVGGQLRLVNVLPGNSAAASHAVIGSGKRLAGSFGRESQMVNIDHAISADGSHIFWSDGSDQVYVRIDGKETVKIEDPGAFITATPDGSKVMLSDGCLYSLASKSCEATLGNSPAGFLGILGASEDLSRVYFADTEALAPGAQPGACESEGGGGRGREEEEEGKVRAGFGCNVYAFDHGEVTFIATLNENDDALALGGADGAWRASPSDRTAQVSTDGRFLAFMSDARLSTYDNHAGNINDPYGRIPSGHCGPLRITPNCREVYEYDLDSKTLSCPSCNPSGLRPRGRSSLSLVEPAPGASFRKLENLPAEGEGQLFFQSTDVLSPADHNGRIQDIYEWQPNGVGGCKRAKGCVSLISGGNGSTDAFFLTSTPNGSDVFFTTREQLLLRDKDDLIDAYDARVDGGINENTPPPCLGEACKGPATSAPEGQSAGSAQFSGPGNEKPHKKKSSKKHKKKHKHNSKKKAHKRAAKNNRGGQQ